MSWKYNIYVSPNTVKETRGGFATREEAQAAARERAKGLRSPVGAPGGQDILSIDVIEERELIPMAVPCMCTSAFCGHELGEPCGNSAKVAIKRSFALDEAMTEFTPEAEVGICEECWARVTQQLPWLFGVE